MSDPPTIERVLDDIDRHMARHGTRVDRAALYLEYRLVAEPLPPFAADPEPRPDAERAQGR